MSQRRRSGLSATPAAPGSPSGRRSLRPLELLHLDSGATVDDSHRFDPFGFDASVGWFGARGGGIVDARGPGEGLPLVATQTAVPAERSQARGSGNLGARRRGAVSQRTCLAQGEA